MRRLNLATKLTLLIGTLSTLIVSLVLVAVFMSVYLLTEERIKANLIAQTHTLIAEHILYEDGLLTLRDTPDYTLVGRLRAYDVSMYLRDTKSKNTARYGIYRELTPEQEQLLLPDSVTSASLTDNRGHYADVYLDEYGLYDGYLVPLVTDGQTHGYLQIVSRNAVWPALLSSIKLVSVVSLPIVWLLSSLVGSLGARQVLAPLTKLVEYLDQIKVESLPRRLSAKPELDSEVSRLVTAFNLVLERIFRLRERERQLSENISHELKTPLTRMASTLDVAKLEGRLSPAQMARLSLEIRELSGGVDYLLNQVNPDEAEQVELVGLVMEQLKSLQNRRITKQLPKQLQAKIYPSAARIIVRNLVENAQKYTTKNDEIVIELESKAGEFGLIIRNPAKSPSNLARITGRGVRGHRRETGYGIGLALAQEIAAKSGGEIQVGYAESQFSARWSGKLVETDLGYVSEARLAKEE